MLAAILSTALFHIVWKNSLRRFKVVRTPEQTNKRKEVLPPWLETKIMVLQSCWDLKVTKWGRSEEGRRK
jgi:hypothetical protein